MVHAGAGWAGFVYLSRGVAKRVPGREGLALGMSIAAISMIPFAVPIAGELLAVLVEGGDEIEGD